MTAVIEARNVSRAFGAVPAVRDASLQVSAGRITALVGPNGAGKTTLMLMLASLLAPDAGEIRIGGVDPVARPQEARRLLGWMPDALGAWGALTARETLTVTGRLYDLDARAARARTEELLEVVGLAELAASPARVLSRGQKQRLGLARALVHRPAVLILDEPASGLDPEARVSLRMLLRALAADGCGVLISSHVLSELDEMADDAVFLLDGATVAPDRVAAASARVRAWRLRLADDAHVADARERVAATLGRLTADVRPDRQGFVLGFAGEAEASVALRSLVEAGLPVVEFAPASGNLENVLLDLREGGASGSGRDAADGGTTEGGAR